MKRLATFPKRTGLRVQPVRLGEGVAGVHGRLSGEGPLHLRDQLQCEI